VAGGACVGGRNGEFFRKNRDGSEQLSDGLASFRFSLSLDGWR
jgi:hypothetical protein